MSANRQDGSLRLIHQRPKMEKHINGAGLETKLANLPAGAGVYLFRDSRGTILYIGKAKSLRQRVRSYFQSNPTEILKAEYLQRNAADLDYFVTDNEVEALILEASLVKKHQPRLNARLKDDKSFLHIKLSMGEDFPRVLLTRRIRNDKGIYFGPYLPAATARTLVKIINRHFLLRTCSIEIDGKLERPCLEYHIKRCLAPCVSGLCTKEQYARAVEDVILLLEGKNDQLIASLSAKMLEASEKERYEVAAFFRDRIALVQRLAEKQKMATVSAVDWDVFAYYREGPCLALQLFTMRNGRIAGKREFFWEDLEVFDPSSFLADAIAQYYMNSAFLPHRVFLPVEVEDQEVIERWLNEKDAGPRRKVRIVVPKRGEKLDLLMLVERNAKVAFDSRFRVMKSGKEALLASLQEALGLPQPPNYIEAFDISNIQGTDSVASMVVCRDGVMSKKDYRKFKIKSVEGPNDFASMHEVVKRRYRRLIDEESPLPDLILIDGGKGQLHFAYQALSELGLDEVPLASIAKREELIFVQGEEEPIALSHSSPLLHLIQEIRDEAHRFAVSYHRKRRSIRDFSSELDGIEGIGEKRRKRLLQNFGSVARILQASVEELTPFVGATLAQKIKERLGQAQDEPGQPQE